MSPQYEQEIINLRMWFIERLPALGNFTMTQAEYKFGCDFLPEPWKSLTAEAYKLWLSDRNYELSYRQMCEAFFYAASYCGVLELA
jgi:hypothetical protein